MTLVLKGNQASRVKRFIAEEKIAHKSKTDGVRINFTFDIFRANILCKPFVFATLKNGKNFGG